MMSGYRYRLLVGYTVLGVLGGITWGLRIWAGSWDAFGALALKVSIYLFGFGVLSLIALAIGSLLWECYDSEYHDAKLQPGVLKGAVEDWLERREQKKAAALLAAKQDGQTSLVEEARGAVSVVKP